MAATSFLRTPFLRIAGRVAIALAMIVMVLSTASVAQADDKTDIRDCFVDYKKALAKLDGKAALALVDTNTIKYYGQVLQHARKSTAEEVKALGPFDKMLVLLVRHSLTPNQMKEMDGEALFVHAINDEWTDSKGLAPIQLQDIKVQGDKGTAKSNAQPLTAFAFSKEDGRWKLDVTAIVDYANKAIAQVVKGSGQPEDLVVVRMLQISTGRIVAVDIWDPKG